MSIEWGVWQDTGLVADGVGQANVVELARHGVQVFAADCGARLFSALCGCAVPVLAVFPVDWVKFGLTRAGRIAPLFRDIMRNVEITAASTGLYGNGVCTARASTPSVA